MFSYATPEERAALITGLRDLAAYLEAHPEVPVFGRVEMNVSIIGDYGVEVDDADKRAELERIAALADAPIQSRNGQHTAKRGFGPVTYRATAIDRARMDAHQALYSYEGSVQPDAA
ncbi:hypothetical protein CLV63_113207 [Murinocardiopsis flavida]|uniref:Uncharacterized protein n=1 Tax=Murinocardiopsis flavida TaxID=645275 RepID=A0A2P8DFP3_9ACTN|nr:hypothetical protein [Murinocardiopsis flavida]PSK96044.1 hypothetical protein CLV63_113207 [Murinocardiopsis flavida]